MTIRIFGSERGRQNAADIIRTSDNVDVNTLWDEFASVLEMYNSARDPLVSLLTRRTTDEHDVISIGNGVAQFEGASEYGVPVGHRAEVSSTAMGYTFGWKDLSFKYTWQYLIDVSSSQLASNQNLAIEAASRETFTQVMEAAFGNTKRANKIGTVVFPWFNGDTSHVLDTPDRFGSVSFSSGHNHFLTTGASSLGPEDVAALEDTITEHGYRSTRGNTLLLLAPKALIEVMRQWRSTANGGSGRYDFIPAQGTPSFLLPQNTFTVNGGAAPAATYAGLDVKGSYGEFLVIEEPNIPAGYLLGFATGGQDSLPNPITIREHSNAALRGLTMVKGKDSSYPLVDSYYALGMGTGIRHRGAGAVLQVTAGSYTVPSFR